ncbi:MAG: 30S ribosomal protein S6 [Actinobacteria bacterium]|nr:30S ribosomal protein S6 [Actinomycetota bacterium]
MTEYEILLLLDPDLTEDRQTEIVTRIRETVERGGTWDRHDVWGRRKLAYEIDHKPEGFYHLLLFSTEPETLDEITRVLRITDGVLRHLAVRRLKSAAPAQPEAAQPAAQPEPVQEQPVRAEPVQEEQAEPAEAVHEAG